GEAKPEGRQEKEAESKTVAEKGGAEAGAEKASAEGASAERAGAEEDGRAAKQTANVATLRGSSRGSLRIVSST
ncbi:unnamed protein product, partial [Prorocentrum cordatum]